MCKEKTFELIKTLKIISNTTKGITSFIIYPNNDCGYEDKSFHFSSIFHEFIFLWAHYTFFSTVELLCAVQPAKKNCRTTVL